MVRALIVGGLIFLSLIIIRLPAGLISWFLPEQGPVSVLNLAGTVWTGTGEVLAEGRSMGRLHWQFSPVTILKGAVGYDFQLSGSGIDLSGRAHSGFTRTRVELSGLVTAPFVNQWLAPYQIELSGQFQVTDVTATLQGQILEALAGQIHWDGGPIRYTLSGILHTSALPAVIANLGPGAEAVANAVGEPTPLLTAALQTDGYARFGVTKYLTRLLGEPWPGGDPDHAVVLEVEEQVF